MTMIIGTIASSVAKGAFAFDSIASATGNNTTFSFTSIPGTYKALRLHIYAQSGTTQKINFTFNGDSGQNYAIIETSGSGSGTVSVGQGVINTTSLQIAPMYIHNIRANRPYVGIIDINDYASTTRLKTGKSYGGLLDSTNGNMATGWNGFRWNSTSAITTITFTMSGTQTASTSFALYGVK